MKQIEVTIKGVCPLLHNRFPIEEHGENQSRAKKKVYVAKDEAEKACYRGQDGKLYQPSEHILGSLIKAAVNFKFAGKKTFKDIVKGGVVVEPELIPLGKKTWDDIDARRAVVNRSAVVRYRPKFNDWTLNFVVQIMDDENLSSATLKEIMDKAGQQYGIGDYRPRFGRFQVVGWEDVDEKKKGKGKKK